MRKTFNKLPGIARVSLVTFIVISMIFLFYQYGYISISKKNEGMEKQLWKIRLKVLQVKSRGYNVKDVYLNDLVSSKKFDASFANTVKRHPKVNMQMYRTVPSYKESGMYVHEVKTDFLGRYIDLMLFLRELEKNEPGIYWKSININSKAYPMLRMQLDFFVLNLNKHWIDFGTDV